MKNWENRAIALLDRSLYPVPAELNELDWKSMLSDNSEKLARHLSAFSHLAGGGFMVFGIGNDGGLRSVSREEAEETIKKLGNIARNNLANPVTIDHALLSYKENSVLFIHIEESRFKPVHLRGASVFDSYKRSAGQTVKMSQDEVRSLIAQSQNLAFEDQVASQGHTADEVLQLLDYDAYFRLSGRPLPDNKAAIMNVLSNEGLTTETPDGLFNITNL